MEGISRKTPPPPRNFHFLTTKITPHPSGISTSILNTPPYPLRWVPEVFLARGRRKFFAWRKFFALLRRPKAYGTSSEAARKASGTERFHSPFPLNFDQFYRITFKPITASISHCDHMDWHVKTWQSTVRDICTFAVLCSVIWPFCRFARIYEGHIILCIKEEF